MPKSQNELIVEALAKTDWPKLASIDDHEVERRAETDPDNPPASEDELKHSARPGLPLAAE